MNCIAIRSAGRESSQDYTVQDFDQRLGKPVLEDAVPLLDEANPSIAVIRHRGAWHVLAMSLSSSRFDRTAIRNNKNTVLWRCDDQKLARALAAGLLRNWDDVCKIVDGFITASTDAQGWRADDRKLGEAAARLAAKEHPMEDAPMFDSRLERPYTLPQDGKGPESKQWKDLADELLRHALPEEDRVHICVTGWPSEDALRKLRPVCTRLLHKGAAADRRLDVQFKPDEPPKGLLSKLPRFVREYPLVTIGLLLFALVVAPSLWPKKKAIERLGFSEVEEKGSLAFSAVDLTNLPSLVSRLKQSSRAIDTWLNGQLSSETKAALAGYEGQNSNPAPLTPLLLGDLNKLREGSAVYEMQRFTGVELRPVTRTLLQQTSQEKDFARLNRLLIEDAFPLELRRNQKKAVRLVITFGKVKSDELNRAPDLQTPQGWSAAPKGWDLASRSWSVQLTSSDSKRDVRFTIAFPFEVGEQLPEINSPPAWTVGREWQGQKMVVNVHMAGATP